MVKKNQAKKINLEQFVKKRKKKIRTVNCTRRDCMVFCKGDKYVQKFNYQSSLKTDD